MNKAKIPDEDYNKNFQALLAEFHSIKQGENKKYGALYEKVNSVNPLSPAQSSGIKERCRHAISGEYFKSKTILAKEEKPEKK